MPRVIVSPQARTDMDEIFSYITQDNPDAAGSLLAKLKEKFALLADAPGIGASRQGLQSDLFKFPFGNYVIFYRRRSENIEIVRVLHGARDIDKII